MNSTKNNIIINLIIFLKIIIILKLLLILLINLNTKIISENIQMNKYGI
jgi:hypothetical protein